ncbi:hypothetical protein QOM21_23975 [Streptomyces sp. Pv4-95]|uniref:hypothetical protein n=1 Tax=Streptomyces sp. Pv4-95 TaxID=3049543 RepID=UPI003892B647
MTNLAGVQYGDIAAWVGVLLSLFFSVTAFIQGRTQSNAAKEAAEATHRQAEAAERRAIAVETALLSVMTQLAEREPRQRAEGKFKGRRLKGGDAMPPPERTDEVEWVVERRSKHVFALRNVGAAMATGVRIDPERIPASALNVPENATVPPGQAIELVMAASFGSPLPGEIWVAWNGHDEPVAVPVPPAE